MTATTGTGTARPTARRSWATSTVRRVVTPAVLGPLVVFVAVVGVWQLGVFHAVFNMKTFTVPYPSGIVGGIGEHAPRLIAALSESLPAAVVGYAGGIVLGFALASLLVLAAPGLANRVMSVLASVNALPIAALAPLLALWIGAGFGLKAVVVVIMVTPTVVVYTMRGFTSVDPMTLELLASYEATGPTVFRTVRVPTALPYVLTAMKSCVVLALIGVIVTEVVTGFSGIGFVIVASLGAFQTVQGWLALLTVSAIGITWYLLLEGLERFAVPWDAATRKGGS
ncbi:MAG TPA: ABC transporter permease subunit [Candidatus Limnocylindrales bacterium]|nr:ABC transporter permease subunit [Candidatus Limnocylindrales bacterium]